MSRERFALAERVFQEAIARGDGDRDAFVRERCGDDSALRDDVLSLLAHHGSPSLDETGPMGAAGRGIVESALREAILTAHPVSVGSYRIVRRLGEGGFGAVYLAEQESPRRPVAVKLMRQSFASADAARRFEYEARILARLRHPGIAQIYEAGIATAVALDARGATVEFSQPFIAMEYVEGPNLTDFALGDGGRWRPIPVADRLTLFERVCDALQHAHQCGVIHRDLKPQNILVACAGSGGAATADSPEASASAARLAGVLPKVLDFGVARVLDAEADLTRTQTVAGHIVGTLAYMSPEQVGGERELVDTRSDVYSMGVLLHQLLSGELPYEVRGLPIDQAARAIREIEPPTVRTLDRSIRSDAHAIVQKAMAKERERRYASMAELAADVRRLGRGEPVAAKRDSGWYVLRKTMWRHRAVIGVVGAFMALVAASSIVGWALYASAERARVRADQLLRDTRLSAAQLTRAGGAIGRRFDTLALLRQAAAIREGDDLRSEAIAALCEPDFRVLATRAWGDVIEARGLDRLDRVAVREADHSLVVRRLEDGAALATFGGAAGPVVRGRFDRAGERFAGVVANDDGSFTVLAWETGAVEPTIERRVTGARGDLSFGEDARGCWLAVASDATGIELIGIPSGDSLGRIEIGRRAGGVAASPDGRLLAVTRPDARGFAIFDSGTGAEVVSIEHPAELRSLCWSPDGRMVGAGAADGRICIWRADDWSAQASMDGHRAVATDLVLGDSMAVSYGWDGSVRIWDLEESNELFAPRFGARIIGFDGATLALSTDEGMQTLSYVDSSPQRIVHAPSALGPRATCDVDEVAGRMAVAGDCGLVLIDLDDWTVRPVEARPALCPMFLDGGRTVAALVGSRFCAWDVSEALADRDDGPRHETIGRHSAYAWASPTADRMGYVVLDPVAGAVSQHRLGSGDAPPGEVTRLADARPGMERPIVDPTGRWLFHGAWQVGEARLIDLRTGATVRAFEGPSVRGSIGGCADGPGLLSVGLPREHLLVDLGDPNRPDRRIPGLPTSLPNIGGGSAVTPDGSLVALVDPPHTLRLADPRSLSALATLPNPKRFGFAELRFGVDGNRLIALTIDDAIVVWDLAELRRLLRDAGFGW